MVLAALDISNNNGKVNMAAVAKAGVQAIVTKASEGVRFADPYLKANLSGMAANGIARGVYHFALPAWNAPIDEAHWFLACVSGLLEPGDVLALDLEEDPYGGTLPADVGAWANIWLSAVAGALGCKPLVYTNADLIQNYNVKACAAGDYGLWIAAPGVSAPNVAPWAFAAMQQTSWTASVPGISGSVDADSFFGDLTTWRAYGIQAAPAPPPDPRPVFGDAERWQFVKWIAGGSGVADLTSALAGYRDP